jgi:divalent metal cation (Fe/Co/Zn/Cd) transporter
VGLVLAFVAVLATWLTGNPVYDALGSIAIGGLLIVVAILLAIELKALLVGQGVEDEVRKEMCAFLENRPEIGKVLNVLTLQMGQDVMVAVKAHMRPTPSAEAMIQGINAVEDAFSSAFPQVAFIFFEPDLAD